MTLQSMVGQEIGPYRLRERVGDGEIACLFRAESLSTGADAAVKVLDLRLRPNAEAKEVFEAEAERLTYLRHEGLIPVNDFGTHKGLFYLAMPWDQGISLADLLSSYRAEGPDVFPEGIEVLATIHGICEALDWAHQNEVIHRNLSPRNIRLDEDGKVRIGDFALDFLLQSVSIDEVLRQLQYVAPEVLSNTQKAVPQSDIFSVGILLYEFLVGEPPFIHPTTVQLSTLHSEGKVIPEDRLPSRLRPGLGEPLENVILQATSLKPEKRFPTGRLLVKALADALEMAPLPDVTAGSGLTVKQRVWLLQDGHAPPFVARSAVTPTVSPAPWPPNTLRSFDRLMYVVLALLLLGLVGVCYWIFRILAPVLIIP